jgi:RNA polymerase sigma-70 factor (ECF subfamily)
MGTSDHSDSATLVGKAAAGDRLAQRCLVDKLHGRVRAVAISILGNVLDAEDTTQVILMEILKSAGTYRGENLHAWSDRIAVRTAIRHARQRRVRGLRFEAMEDIEDFPMPAAREPEGHDLPRALFDYLSELPEARRVALILRHMMDYSIDEVAEATDCSVNTVKDRLLQGRQQLRKMIRRDQTIEAARGRA